MSYPKNGPASRAVALDLVLRTFMNSAEFQPSNPRIWDNIAKLVPGTTPQQVSRFPDLSTHHSSGGGEESLKTKETFSFDVQSLCTPSVPRGGRCCVQPHRTL